jgi:hypothetical protein
LPRGALKSSLCGDERFITRVGERAFVHPAILPPFLGQL